MSIAGNGPKFGAVIASGPQIRSHADCRLMLSAIDLAMRSNIEGRPKLTEWRNDIERIRQNAIRERWIGWEEEFLA